MRLRLVTTRLLVPAAILLAAGGYARALDLPLQLSQFLTGAHPKPKAQPAPEAAKTEPKRHVARHRVAARHVAKHAAEPETHTAHHAPADAAPSVATARPAEPPPAATAAAAPAIPATPAAQADTNPAPATPAASMAENPAPPLAPTTAQYVNGVRVVSAEEFNELDAAADAVTATPAAETIPRNLAAKSSIGTDGRNPDAAAEPAVEQPASQLITWPRAVAFGIGGPLLIGLLAWPLIARRRSGVRHHWNA